jgi:hypothetical protein
MGDAILTRRFSVEPPTVILDQLKLYIDAANSASYPGSGSTVFDLSSSGWNGTFGNGVTYSSDFEGTILFPTNGEGTVNLGQQALYQPNNSPFTVQAFVRFTTQSSSRQMLITRNVSLKSGSPYAWMFGPKSTNQLAVYNGSTWIERPYTQPINQWVNLAVVYNGSQIQYYVNGQPFASPLSFSYSDSTSYNGNLGGYSGTSGMSGYMGPMLYYTKALTASEIAYNFDFFKSRYGL